MIKKIAVFVLTIGALVAYSDSSVFADCSPSAGGDFTITASCAFTYATDGVDNGNLTLSNSSTLTINAGQMVTWNPGKSVTINNGSSIAINTGGGSTVRDNVGANYGTATGTTLVAGQYNKARSFNGSSDYVTITSPSGLPTGSVMTAEAWVYPISYPDATYNGIVSWGPRACTGTSFLMSMINNGKLSFASWCNDAYQSAGSAATLNAWNHVAVVLNGTTVKFYMNGALADTQTVSGGTAPNVQSGVLNIGVTDNPGRYFNGYIDDVRIYNYERSLSQITEDMNNTTITGNPAVAKWTMDDQAQLNQQYLYVRDGNSDGFYDASFPQVALSSQPSSYTRRYLTIGSAYGNGSDGNLSIISSKDLSAPPPSVGSCTDGGDGVSYNVTALTSNTATLSSTPSSGCLEAGDYVLLINLKGISSAYPNVGKYEMLKISSVSTNTVTFSSNKTKYYGNGASDDTNLGTADTNQRVMLLRVPQYGNVTVDDGTGSAITLYAGAWNGTKGGVLAFVASGTVTVVASDRISAGGGGFLKGNGGGTNGGGQGGETYNGRGAWGASRCSGPGTPAAAQGGGGGGGTTTGSCPDDGTWGGPGGIGGGGGGGGAQNGSGGGGGYGGVGLGGLGNGNGYNGSGTTGGYGGYPSSGGSGGGGAGSYGAADLSTIFLGSGGGGEGSGSSAGGSGGGPGAGIVLIYASTVSVSGSILANGYDGNKNVYNNNYGGGGAGGSIKIMGGSVNLGSLSTATPGNGTGGLGTGGVGRIAAGSANTISGSTNPSYTAISGP